MAAREGRELFNAFATTHDDDQLATLARCHAHLVPGAGSRSTSSAPRPRCSPSPSSSPSWSSRSRRLRADAGSSSGTAAGSTLSPDPALKDRVRGIARDGSHAEIHRFDTRVRWVHRFELDLLLRLAGFTRVEVWGGPDRGP